jgi:hypothetical protein
LPARLREYQFFRGKVMAANDASDTFGINQDIKVQERVLHVQTEDLGADQAEILTVVYSAGEVIYSFRNPYSYFQKHGLADLTSQRMVMAQHRGIISSVLSGKLLKK